MSTLTVTTYTMPAAALGRENPLPDLKSRKDIHSHIEVDHETVTDDEARYMGWGNVDTILPYKIQDGYNRRRRRRSFKAIVLENEYLKATFLPQIGGRLWSLFDKDAGRDLIYVNPVFQPCNLALRNAWISGGVEWNVGIVGHSPFTLDNMACQRLTLSDNTPVLRMYQYERVRHLFYRMEAILPDGSPQLYVRVRIDNATMEDTALYWWSNMAVNESEDVRVIVPAEKAFRFGYRGKVSKTDQPYMTVEADKLTGQSAKLAIENGGSLDWDISHPTEIPQSMDFFFDVPPDQRPFIAALDKDGYGICQTSTDELHGRKLFVWGMGAGGRHWQEFLSKKGSSYIELQSGLAKTQLEHLPMKGGESISWVESYGALSADPAIVHGQDYSAAVRCVENALERIRPAYELEAMHNRLKSELDGQNGPTLHKCSGYALVEKALLKDEFDTAGLSLAQMKISRGEQDWLDLVNKGALPCPDPLCEPESYQINSAWETLLRNSIESGRGDHWYANYQLGVIYAARGDDVAARAAFERSVSLTDNPWALRCLAVLKLREGRADEAADILCRAVDMKPIRPLVLEALEALSQAEQYERMLKLLNAVPTDVRKIDRVKIYEIQALIRTGHYDEAETILNGPIVLADIHEGEEKLTDLWFELMAYRKFNDTSSESVRWARENLNPPKHLDFRMH